MNESFYRHVSELGEVVALIERWLSTDDLQGGSPSISAGGAAVLHMAEEGGHAYCNAGGAAVLHMAEEGGHAYCAVAGPCVHAVHKDDALDCAGPRSSAPWARMRPRFQVWAKDQGAVVEGDIADRAAAYLAGLHGAQTPQ